jgi:hypothetical protein
LVVAQSQDPCSWESSCHGVNLRGIAHLEVFESSHEEKLTVAESSRLSKSDIKDAIQEHEVLKRLNSVGVLLKPRCFQYIIDSSR